MIQTNRTLLVEEISPEKENIISAIHYMEHRESLSDAEIKEVHQQLEVSSFEEVIEKFSPKIYMALDTDRMQADFYRRIPKEMEQQLKAVPLGNQTGFFDELVRLIDNKRKHKYVLTSFQDFGASLFNTPSPEGFWELREKIICELVKGHEAKAKKILEKVIAEYDEGIFLVKTYLAEIHSHIEQFMKDGEDLCFLIPEDEGTQVHMVKVSERFERNKYHTKAEEELYFDFLSKNLDEKKLKNRNLMILTLELCCKPKRENLSLLVHYYREYQEYYGMLLQNFWWEAKPLLETLLGIRSFFNSYSLQSGMMPPTMVITNCTPDLLANSKYKDVFRVYLETMNEKNYLDKTIWYAIMPRMPFVANVKAQVRERFASNGSKHACQPNDLESVQVVLDMLGKYHIQTFLSAVSGKDTIFQALEMDGVEEFEASFAFLEKEEHKEFMIPCYPNFLIIPQEYTHMTLGEKIRYDELDGRIYVDEDKMLWLSDLIIEAAYVAAGLQAACQCPKYLSQFYPRNVQQDMPGVAYRLCDDGHNLRTTTQMFPEIMGYSEEVYSQITRLTRGIVFAPYKGKVIVYTDRVYSYKPGRPDCIAIIQTMAYMERVIRYESQDYKEHLIREFFQSRPGSIISQWRSNSDCVNEILKKEEQIEYKINEQENSCTFKIRFKERNIEDVVKISR